MHRLDMDMVRMRNMSSDDVQDDNSAPHTGTGHGDSHTGSTRPKNVLKPMALCSGIVMMMLLGLLFIILILTQLGPNLSGSNASSEQNNSSPQASPLTATVLGRIETKDGDFICSLRECLRAGLSVLDKMDSSVDPCDDFYSYACGGFVKDTKIPYDKAAVHAFTVAVNLFQKQLVSVIGEEIDENEPRPFKLAKSMYKLCMNKTRIEEQAFKPLWDILKSVGGWPLLKGDHWNLDGSWSWVKLMKDLRTLGYNTNYFFDISVRVDLKNTSRRIIYVDQASLNVSRVHLIKDRSDPTVEAYYANMLNMALSLGADEGRANKELQESLDFEKALARISLPIARQRNATGLYSPMSVKEFQTNYPYTDWVDYLNAMFNDTGIVIDENEIIIVRVPSYMEKLGPLLQRTSERTLANYVMWRVARYSSTFLTEKLQRQQPQCSNRKQEHEDRSKECLDITLDNLPSAVGALYVRKYFNDDSRRAALDMTNDIKKAFVDILEQVNWMDANTRKSALEKMDAMIFHIGYPDELMDDNKIIEYYKGLKFKPDDSYLNTVLNMDRFATTKKFQKLRQAVNRTDWSTHSIPSIFSSRYFPTENIIQYTASMLQGQHFSYRLPKYMNYGSIGPIIGRDITHGFDVQGREYDKTGKSVDWWRTTAKLAYLKKSECIIDQYSNYTDPNVNMNVNGGKTQFENIADNSGLKQAYYAYKKWAEKNGPEPRLLGLDLSSEQMFWLSAAQSRCAVRLPEANRRLITSGGTSPDRFRVLGPMSNMVEFSKDFNCPAGSPMNPTVKCQVW